MSPPQQLGPPITINTAQTPLTFETDQTFLPFHHQAIEFIQFPPQVHLLIVA